MPTEPEAGESGEELCEDPSELTEAELGPNQRETTAAESETAKNTAFARDRFRPGRTVGGSCAHPNRVILVALTPRVDVPRHASGSHELVAMRWHGWCGKRPRKRPPWA